MPDRELLARLLPGRRILAAEVTGSTNRDAKALWRKDGQRGDLVIADRQTGGIGRKGHSFASEEGGLYMTLLLKEDLPAGLVTCVAAVAVRRAVKAVMGIETRIKWVNDLQKDGLKVCGILCEAMWSGDALLGQVCGIGLNLYRQHFEPELEKIAGSLRPGEQKPGEKEYLAAEIVKGLLEGLKHPQDCMREYSEHCLTLHQRVCWQQEGESFEGLAEAVTETGGLMVRKDDGNKVILDAGEVSVRTTK